MRYRIIIIFVFTLFICGCTDGFNANSLLTSNKNSDLEIDDKETIYDVAYYHKGNHNNGSYYLLDYDTHTVLYVSKKGKQYYVGTYSGDLENGICMEFEEPEESEIMVYSNSDKTKVIVNRLGKYEYEYRLCDIESALYYIDRIDRTYVDKNEYYNEMLNIGDIVQFGYFEQDNDTMNGKEPIDWIVLLKDGDGSALVTSLYLLEYMDFNEASSLEYVTWNESSIREWLNTTFIEEAFSEEERENIYLCINECDGEETEDYISLLTYEDVCEFFPEQYRKATTTEYARNHEALVSADGYSAWWTMTSGYSLSLKYLIDSDGEINDGIRNDCSYGIRPTMWIDLNNAIQLK